MNNKKEKAKKPFYKKWWFWVLIVIALGALGNLIDSEPVENNVSQPEQSVVETVSEEKVVEPVQDKTEEKKATETSKKPSSEETTSSAPAPENTMVAQFQQLGFTEAEAKDLKSKFETVGITQISNIQTSIGSGIDDLQSYVCNIFNYKNSLSLQFTIENRQLCYISLNGIPTEKVSHLYINVFGNVKTKVVNSTKSAVLYDLWDEDGEIIKNGVGYKAVFDYENSKITAY